MSVTKNQILQFALENGIIDINTIQTQIEMAEKQKYLNMHQYEIWQSETDGFWRTYLPDEQKGRRLVKRKSRKSIDDLLIDYYMEHSEDTKKKEKNITLLEIFPEWLKFKQIHTNSTSYTKRITADWKKYYTQETELINKPLCEMTKVYLDAWSHGVIKKYDMTKKMYYNMSIILRQSLDYAVECGYIEENEFSKVKINTKLFRRTKKKKGDTQVYNQNEEEELIKDMIRRFNNNRKNTAPLAVMLLFETGIRIGELCALKFSDIEGNYIHIQRQEVREFEKVDDFTMKFKEFKIVEYAKSEDGYRDVYLTDTARGIIEVAKMMNEENKEKNQGNFIFCKNGKNINHYSIQAMIKRGCEFINIDVKTSHKIRKTYISTLIDSGLNIDEIRRMVGHSDERTTYGNYCFNRLTNKQTEDAIEKALFKEKVIKSNQNSNLIEFKKRSNLAV